MPRSPQGKGRQRFGRSDARWSPGERLAGRSSGWRRVSGPRAKCPWSLLRLFSPSGVEGVDGVTDVVLGEIGVQGDGGRGAGAGGGDDLGARVDDVACGPHARDGGAAGGVRGDPAVVVDLAAQVDEEPAVRYEARRDEQRLAGHDAAVVHLDAAQLVVVDDQLFDRAFDDDDGAGDELGPLGGGEGVGWGEVDEIVGPLPDDMGVADGARGAADNAELTVADLVAVAVRAVQNVAGPAISQTGDVWQLVTEAGRHQEPPCRDSLPVAEEAPDPAPAVPDQVRGGAHEDLAAVGLHLPPALRQKFARWESVA